MNREQADLTAALRAVPGVADAELVVVCTPVELIVPNSLEAAEHCPPDALITDVGSTKADIVASMEHHRRALAARRVRFVGSHPMAGSEKSGPEFAQADLFDGSVTVGPNAVQGWMREGYGRINFSIRDTAEMLSFPGFWRVTADNLGVGLAELWNSLWKPGYLKQVQKYCPSVRLSDLRPYPAGIRAQAVRRDGTLVDDFLFAETPRSLHVCSAPSPAATSAIPIGDYLCDKILEKAGS